MSDKRESYGHDMNNTDTVIVQQCKECGYVRFGKLTHGYHDDGYCMGDYATLANIPMVAVQVALRTIIKPEWLASAAFLYICLIPCFPLYVLIAHGSEF